MAQKKESATLKQIALQAGVSLGTVDRVLHNRGRVNEETRARVQEIVAKLGYQPNIHASMISVRRSFKIAVLIPYFQTGEFWSMIYDGVQEAVAGYRNLDISLSFFYYNQFGDGNFDEVCRTCLDFKPDGVLLAPINRAASSELVKTLYSRNVPTVLIDTNIEDIPYFAYFGTNLYGSGYVLADLLFSDNGGKVKKVAVFDVDRKGGGVNASMENRFRGFSQYIEDNGLNCEILRCSISASDFLSNVKVFDEFFREHPDVHHAVTFSSRAHMISDWKEINGYGNLAVYGYDATPANVSSLRKGAIRMLISGHTRSEAGDAMKALLEKVVAGAAPARKDTFYPIDILTRYNVEFYQ